MKEFSQALKKVIARCAHPQFREILPWGVCVALFMAYFLVAIMGKLEYSEVLANVVIIAGALLVASGSVVSRGERNKLLLVMKRQAASPTKAINEKDLLGMKLQIAQSLKEIVEADDVSVRLDQWIQELEGELRSTPEAAPALSKRFVASAFLSASDNSEAGTLLIVLGTVGLVAIKLVEILAKAHAQ